MDHVIHAFKMEACNPIDTSVVFSLLLSCKKKFLFWKMFQHFMFVGLARHYFFFFSFSLNDFHDMSLEISRSLMNCDALIIYYFKTQDTS